MSEPGRTAILLIAHGSRQHSANEDLQELAARLAAQGTYPIVEPCFLELAEPELKAGGDRCVELGATRVLMIPYFLSEGVHLRRDLTAARDELNRRHPDVEFAWARLWGRIRCSMSWSPNESVSSTRKTGKPATRHRPQSPLTQIEQRHSVRRPISPWMEMVHNTRVNASFALARRRQRSDRR